ncbi:MAG: efflux RND transporter permease subunit [Methylotenera sp.]|nr:efflux RND transporter permease subunit [Methylotenera sp.]MDP2282122.1 efflux RND transporter permease subunit [Methylotenera sp.]MDP2404139.1 efflux RND transporter permease subunit [Methylotenera sp.]MDP3061504.1 efflux RND transporter permease subunit [Methylotenera sp.]MDP3095397.1 efflux RND transporter permease subunit [Methylotenera sp.]
MTLPEFSIKRHVLTWMLSGVIVLFGIISYQRIGVDRIPAIDFPIIMVNTTLRGANPDVIDTSITSVIESAINTTPGIEHIQSSSSPGFSSVSITFSLDKNIDAAYNEVQAKVNQVLRRLPADTDPPIIQKVDTNASAVIWLALSGDRTIQQLNLYANNVLKKKFETINGVGEVTIGGRRDRMIRVNVLPERMAAYKLTTSDLITAFNREHIQLPGGFLVSAQAEQLLKLDMEFHTVKELAELIVTTKSGASIRLKDIAMIEDGISDNRQIARYNGKPTVGLGMIKIANANTVAIIKEVERRLENDIRPNLAPGLTLEISSNDSIFINQLVASLKEHLVEGTLFAALIVLIFMRSFSSTLMVCLEIPVSLLGAIAVMYFAGYTFNSMTMLALLLLIGVVVDDAIVVRESILRHMEGETGTGLSDTDLRNPRAVAAFRKRATIKGSNEVVFAVMASSAALVCIFAPVIFMDGIIGKFFKSFAVVVTFGVLVSLFVSLTLTPMLCSRYLGVTHNKNAIYRMLGRMLTGIDNVYKKLLYATLNHRGLVLLSTLIFVGFSGFYTLKYVEKDFVPETDESSFSIRINTPLGSTLDYTDSRLKLVEAAVASHIDEVDSYFSTIGAGSRGQVNQGNVNVRLKPKEARNKSQKTLIKELKTELDKIPGIRALAAPPSVVRGQRSEKLQFNLTGANLQEIGRISQLLQQALSNNADMGKVDLDVQLDLPQLNMQIDRATAASLGLNAADIATAVSLYAGGINVAKYNEASGDGQRYDIRLKATEGDLSNVADLSKIYLRNATGDLIRLDAVASFKQALGPAVIGRYDLQYAANFYANPSMPLGEAVDLVKEIASKIVPPDYTLKLTGQAEEFGKTFTNIKFVLLLAFTLLYMVLASQFNSFIQPFIIMLAQPLAIIGGLIALLITGDSLNMYSMIGLVLLIGLVAKNSILLVDLTNQLIEKGANIDDALKEACPIRVRPVVMTSLTIILALLPAALGLGAGSETNKPLSVAIIGGMISSTLLTLVVVPAAYSLVMGRLSKWSKVSVV